MSVFGIDISNNNATVDLVQAQSAGGIQFLAHKATEGTFFKDALLPARWRQAADLGLVRIAYDFGRPDLSGPEEEADAFCDYVAAQGFAAGDCLALDLEMSPQATAYPGNALPGIPSQPFARQRREVQHELRRLLQQGVLPARYPTGTPRDASRGNPSQAQQPLEAPIGAATMLAWALAWLKRTQQNLGPLPLFYSGLWFMQPQGLLGDPTLAQSGLWYGYWASQLPPPPSGWDFIAIWQNSGSATVPGIGGPCDTDVFQGSVEQLRAYGYQPAPAPPKPALTNDAIVQVERYLLAQPPDPASAIAYLQQFS